MHTGTPLSRLGRKLQDSFLPVRRMLSRAVLVYEERHFRELAVEGVYSALAAEGKRLRTELKSLEERAIIRLDILMEELWRRMEGVGARQATEIQRLSARLDDLQERSAEQVPELRRLVAQMAQAQAMAEEVSAIRLAGGSAAPDPTLRWETYVKELHGFEPVVDLTTDGFVEVATTAGLGAYAAGGDPVQHLRSLPDGSLGGAFCGEVPQHTIDPLLGELARALQPGGVAIFETSDGTPPDLLAAVRAAGLDVEDNGLLPVDGRLAGVSEDLSDPALKEIALGINGLVSRLNEVLHGPREHGLVARRAE